MNKNNVNLFIDAKVRNKKIPVYIYIIFIRCILFYLVRKIKKYEHA